MIIRIKYIDNPHIAKKFSSSLSIYKKINSPDYCTYKSYKHFNCGYQVVVLNNLEPTKNKI